MADDIREGEPKNTAPPSDDDDDRPRKKQASGANTDETPKKKLDEDRDLGSSPLSAVLPVGGSIFALLSLWLSVLCLVLALVSLGSQLNIVTVGGVKIPPIATCLLPALWPFAALSGILSFFTQKHKASYGSIAGNMRAIIGILISLVVMVLHAILVVMYFKA